MKRVWIVSLVGFVVLMASAFGSDVYAGTSYPLVCNPGGGMRFRIETKPDFSKISIMFRGASTGASTKQPAPGECAWLDRGWRAGEPQEIYYIARGFDVVGLHFDANFNLTSWTMLYDSTKPIIYLLDNMKRKTIFHAHAQQDRSTLKITRTGP